MTEMNAETTGESPKADGSALKAKAGAAKEAVKDLAGEAKHYAAGYASGWKDRAADWASTAKDKASDISDTVADYVQRNPYKSLGMAIGIGFVAGLLLKRR